MTQQEQIRQEQEAQIAAPPKPHQRLVQSISNIFHPLLTLTYTAIIISVFTLVRLMPFQYKAWFVGIVAIYTLVLPALIITLLHITGFIGHWALRDRRDRMVPFFTNFVCYTACAYLLYNDDNLPNWVVMPYAGSVFLTFVAWIVSWKWKISAHAAANAAGATYFLLLYRYFMDDIPLWLPLFAIIVVGAVCSTRIYLGRHTLAQVSLGTLLGIVSILLADAIFIG